MTMRQRKSTKKTNSGSRNGNPGKNPGKNAGKNSGPTGPAAGPGSGDGPGTFLGRILPGVLAAAWCMPAMAGPEGAQVVNGNVQFERIGDVTNITASNNAIINYRNFDIAANETVRFIQPDAASRVLNRINSSMPTQIDGTLTANGRVYLVNPSGVFFSKTAVISTGSIYAAAAKISDADFAANIDRFTDAQGVVHNAGQINATDTVALIGKTVANTGKITAPQGTVMMLAGDEIYIGQRDGKIFTKISTKDASGDAGTGVTQAGTIEAPGGRVRLGSGDMYSLAIRHSGRTKARDVLIEGGQTGEVRVSGTIDAANQVQTPTGTRGGEVRVLGEKIAIDGAKIDASGVNGGGQILVGGNYLGQGPERNATHLNVTRDSVIAADATVAGDGGRVIMWSDVRTRFDGTITLRGGEQGGNGGFAEVSGKQSLQYTGFVNALAPKGKVGDLLLDPLDIRVVASGGTETLASASDFDDNSNNERLNASVIEGAAANVTLRARRDITFEVPITMTNNGVGLTAEAGDDIVVDPASTITTRGGNVTFRANFQSPGSDSPSGNGSITINSPILTNGGGQTNGQIILDVQGGTGDISISATGALTTAGASGNIVLTANEIEIDPLASITGVGSLFLEPSGDAINIAINGTPAAGVLDLTQAELDRITDGWSSITIGRSTGTGTTTIAGTASFVDPVTFRSAGAGSAVVSNALSATGNGAFTFDTTATLTAGITTAGGNIAFNRSGSVGATITVDAGSGIVTKGATGTLDISNTFTLTLTGTGGVTINGALTGTGSGALTVTGGAVNVNSTITLAGGTFNSSGSTFTSAAAGDIDAGTAGTITLNHTGAVGLSGDLFAQTLTINAGSSGTGNLTFGGPAALRGNTIALRAGSGAGTAAINALTNAPTFRNAAGTGNPTTFTHRQDDALVNGNMAARTQFNGGTLSGVNYTLRSDALGIDISDGSKVRAATLTLNSATLSTMSGAITGTDTLAQLTVVGPVRLAQAVAVTGTATFGGEAAIENGLTTSNANITFNGNAILAGTGATVDITTNNGAVAFNNGLALSSLTSRTVNAGTGQVTLAASGVFDGSAGGGPIGLSITAGDVSFSLAQNVPFDTSSISITSTGNVGINTDLAVQDLFNIAAAGTIDINGTQRAVNSITLHSGTDGTGNMSFTGAGRELNSASISLRAGDGAAGGNAAFVDITSNVTFTAFAGGATRPDTFALRQDAALAPVALARFGAGIAGMAYSLISDAGTVNITTAADVADTFLTVGVGAASTISANLTAADSLRSFTGSGPLTISGGLNIASGAGTRFATFNGATTVSSNITAANLPITFNAPITISGTREISAGTGTLTTGASATINVNSGALTLTGDELELGANISGGGTLTLRPASTSGIAMLLGGNDATGAWHLSAAELARYDGLTSVTIGRSDFNDELRIQDAITVNDPTTFEAGSGGSSNIVIAGNVTGAGNASLSFPRFTFLLADVSTANQAISFGGSVRLQGTNPFTRTINAGTGAVSLTGTNGNATDPGATFAIIGGDVTSSNTWSTTERLSAFNITASGAISITGDIETTNAINFSAANGLDLQANLLAPTSLTLAAGSDGTGDLTFTGAGRSLSSASISLRAGDGPAGGNAAVVNPANVTLRGAAGGATRPDTVVVRQDAAITDALDTAFFGTGISGLVYTLQSDAAGVAIVTASRVADTFLTVSGATNSAISAVLTGSNSLRSFTGSGPMTISGGMNIAAGAGTRFATFNGPTTLSADVSSEGLPITFTNSLTLAGANRSITTNFNAPTVRGDVIFNTTSNGSATGTGAGFGLAITGRDVTMSLPSTGLGDFTIDATGNVVFGADVTSATLINAVANGTLNVNNATLRATNTLSLRSDFLGQGSRNLTFTGTPTLRSAAITLFAGDGTTGATNTSSAVLTNASLRNDAGTANPTTFTHRQGDAIVDNNIAAGSAWSGGSPTGVNYSLRSDRLGIVIDTAAKVRGSDLTIQGVAPSTINANLGTVGDALRSFTANSVVTIASTGGLRVSNGTNGAAVFNSGATVNADISAVDAGGLINFASTLATGTSTVTLSADEIDFGAAVTGTGTLTLQQFSTARNMRINDAADDVNRLDITSTEFAFLPGTYTSLIFGASSGTGTLDLGAALTTASPTTLRAATTGLVNINQNITAGAPLTLTGPTSLAANITSASQAILFNSRVSIDGGARTLDTTNAGGSAGANITFGAQIDSATTQDLTLRAGAGNISTNSIGVTDRLGTLTITSAADVTTLSTRVTGLVQTAGSGTSNFGSVNATTGGVNVTGTNFTFANGITSAAGNVGINGVGVTISGGLTTTSNATVDILHSGVLAISGTAFNLDGSFTETFSGSGTTTLATGITTSNDNINFNGPVTITQNAELNAGTALVRQLASTATFTIDAARTLTLTADDAQLAANIGGTGAVVIQPFTVAQNILLNAAGGGSGLVVQQSELNLLQPTLSSATFGRANSTGAITLADPLTFNASSVFRTTGAGTITVDAAATGAGAAGLTFLGTSTVNAPVATGTGDITFDGGSTIGGNVTSNGGNIRFTGPTLFAGTRTVNAGTGTIFTNSGASLAFGSNTLTLIADEMDFAGAADSISGAGGVLNLIPFTNTSVFGINLGSAVGTNPPALDLSQSDLDTIAANLLRLDIGATSGGLNPIRAGNTNLKAPTRLLATGGGSISVLTGTRVVGLNNGASLTFTGDGSGTGLINLLGDLATSGATITLNDSVSIGGTRLIDTTNVGAAALGANIILNSDVTGAGGGSPTLALNAGSAGAITAGTIGVGTRLQGLQVVNAGSGTFNGLIEVGADGINVNGILFSFNAGANSIDAGGFTATHTGLLTIANSAFQLAGPFSQSGSGTVAIGADISAAGFTLNSATAVSAPVTLSGGTGTLAINGDFNGGANDITLASDEINFGSSASILNTGDLCLQPVTLNLPITLGGTEQSGSLDLTLADLQRIQTSTGELCIGAANGTGDIRLEGPVTFNRPVRFRGLAPSVFVFNADWLVDSGISFDIPVRVGGAPGSSFEFRTGTGTAAFNSTLDVNGRAFTITGDEINFAQNVTTTPGGELTLRPFTFGRGIRIGDSADVSGWLNILDGEVNQIGNNFSLITFGRADLGAPILFPGTLTTTRTLVNPTRLLAGPGNGAVTVLRDIKQSDALEAINFEAATINLSRSIVTVGGNINLEGRAILVGDTVLNTNDLGASGPTGGDLNLTALSSIESDAEGTRALTIGTGDGNAVLAGEIKTPSIGLVTFTGNAVEFRNPTITARRLDFAAPVLLFTQVTLTGNETDPSLIAVNFRSTINGADTSGRNLTVNTPGGAITRFAGLIGTAGQFFGTIETDAAGSTHLELPSPGAGLPAIVATFIIFNDDVLLLSDTTVRALGQHIYSDIDSATTGAGAPFSLNIIGGSPFNPVALDGRIGVGAAGGSALRALNISGSTLVRTDQITVTEGAFFNDSLDLGNNLTLNAATTRFNTINSVNVPRDLIVNAGDTIFGGNIGTGSARPILGLLRTDASGTTSLDAAQLSATSVEFLDVLTVEQSSTITATNRIEFANTVEAGVVNADLTLDSPSTTLSGVLGGGTNSFGNLGLVRSGSTFTINAASGSGPSVRAQNITVNGTTILGQNGLADLIIEATQAASFNAINASDALGSPRSLQVRSPGTVTFNGDVGAATNGRLAGFTTDAAGTTRFNAATLNAGAISIADALVLGNNATFISSGTAVFGSTIDSDAPGSPRDLFINSTGAARLDGVVGGTARLRDFTASGATTINTDRINAASASFLNPVTLQRSTTIDTTGNQLFTGEVNGGSLAVVTALTNIAGGNVSYNANVGFNPDGTFGVAPASLTTTAANISLRSVRTGGDQIYTIQPAGGSINLFGGLTSTNVGAISLAGPLVLTGDSSVITAGNASFLGTVNSDTTARTLNIDADGVTLFTGEVGGTNPLRRLRTNAAGTTRLDTAALRATERLEFFDAVTLVRDTTLTGGSINFGGTVDGSTAGSEDLVLNTSPGSSKSFNGNVGGTVALATLTTNAAGVTQVSGSTITTTGNQTYNDSLAVSNGTLAVGGNLLVSGSAGVNGNVDAAAITVTGPASFSGTVNSRTGGQTYNNALTLQSGALNAATTLFVANTATINGTATSVGNTTINGGLNMNGGSITSTAGGISVAGPADANGTLTSNGSSGITLSGGGRYLRELTANNAGSINVTQATTLGADVIAAGTGNVTLVDPTLATGLVRAANGEVILNGITRLDRDSVNVDGRAVTLAAVESLVAADARSLVVTASDSAALNGPIGAGNRLGNISVTRRGGDNLASMSVGAPINATGKATFGASTITLTGDTTIDASAGMLFRGNIVSDGTPRSLTVRFNRTPTLTTGANNENVPVGDITPVVFGGNLGGTGAGQALRDITLGDDLGTIPELATFIMTSASQIQNDGSVLTTESAFIPTAPLQIIATGNITMGLGQKFTALGSLAMTAGGVASISDLVALNELSVTAPTIQLVRRTSGAALLPRSLASPTTYQREIDNGVDYVAERISFNGAIGTIGTGPVPVFSARSGAISGVDLNAFGFKTLEEASFPPVFRDYRFAAGVAPGSLRFLGLDYVAGATPVNIASAIAGAIPRDTRPPRIEVRTDLTKEALDILLAMGITVKSEDGADSVLEALTGRGFYDDVPAKPFPGQDDYRVSARRLDPGGVTALVRQYVKVFGSTGTDVAKGLVGEGELGAAARRYADTVGVDNATTQGFRAWLEATPEESQSLAALNEVRTMLAQTERIGLSSFEASRAKSAISRLVLDAEQVSFGDERPLSTDEMESVITGEPVRERQPASDDQGTDPEAPTDPETPATEAAAPTAP
jgi:filamentous hemagglutinin family protein